MGDQDHQMLRVVPIINFTAVFIGPTFGGSKESPFLHIDLPEQGYWGLFGTMATLIPRFARDGNDLLPQLHYSFIS